MLISLILPIYNMERFLKRCMKSIFAQTHQELEILLIDDGSTDRSPAICDAYAKKDARIRVLHKENGGLSSARNAGMELATGTYLFFLDPDDTIPPDAIEKLVRVAKAHPYDVIKGLHNVKNGAHSRRTSYGWTQGTVDRIGSAEERERWRMLKTAWSFGCAWAGLYKKAFLDETAIQFDDNRVIFLEDVLFNSKIMANHPQYYLLCEPVYNYYYVEGSLLNRPMPALGKKLRALLKEYNRYLHEQRVYEENLDLVGTLTARYLCWSASEKAKTGKGCWKRTYQEVKSFGESLETVIFFQCAHALRYFTHLARKTDTCFYLLCMYLLKKKCYSLLTTLFVFTALPIAALSKKRTRV